MRILLLLAGWYLTTLLPLAAQPLPLDPALQINQLENGLTYYLHSNKQPTKEVALRLVVRAGSLQEADDQLGVAHFVEHMAFNGTARYPKNELINFLEKTGARFGPDLNAYTSFEETVYKLQLPADSQHLIMEGLTILREWAGELTFEPGEVDKERGVVISEWRQRQKPDQRMRRQYYPVLYAGSRFPDRFPIGNPELIDTVHGTTIKQFYQDWYRPELMGVIAVGAFDTAAMEKAIQTTFGDLENSAEAPEHTTFSVPNRDTTLFVTATDPEAPFSELKLIIRQSMTPYLTNADYRGVLLRSLYNRMLGYRLYELQQHENPPFTFANSSYGAGIGKRDEYHLSVFAQPENILPGFEIVLQETFRAVQHGFTAEELRRQKAELLTAAHQRARESDKRNSGRLANQYVQHFLGRQPAWSPEQQLALMKKILDDITREDFNDLPDRWLAKQQRIFVLTGPEEVAEVIPQLDTAAAIFEHLRSIDFEPYQEDVIEGPLISDLPEAGTILAERVIDDSLHILEWTLSNGIRIVLKPTDFRNDQILMRAFSPGGHSVYSDAIYPQAFGANLLPSSGGVGNFSATQLPRLLASKRVEVSPYIDELREGFSGGSDKASLQTLFQLVYLYFTQPRVDETAFASAIDRQASVLENLFADPNYRFADFKQRLKYDNHPRRVIADTTFYRAISLQEAERIYRDRFADASDFIFFLVGNFDPDSLRPLVRQYLAPLPAQGRNESFRDTGASLATGPIDTTLVAGQAPKVLLERIYHGAFSYGPENRAHLGAMVDILRRRLREAMREDQGGVYSVRVNQWTSKYPRKHYRISFAFNADPSEFDSLVQLLDREIEQLRQEPPDQEELDKFIAGQQVALRRAFQQNGFWLNQLVRYYWTDRSMEQLRPKAIEARLNAITAADVQAAAKKYLTPDQHLQFILRPETQK